MFDSAFYRINESFDSNLTNYTAFDLHYDYVLRFVVDGWEPSMPDGHKIMLAANAVAKILAQTGDLKVYDVKAVIFSRANLGESVGYYSPSWYSIPWGSGYTDELTAGDGTWTIDLVFRPKNTERAWTNVAKWTQLLSGDADMVGSRGAPRVFCAGLITLDPSASVASDVQIPFVEAATFWSGRHAFWQISSAASEGSSTGFVGDSIQINEQPPMLGWNMFSSARQVGHDGLGISKGSAFRPYQLVPIAVAGTIDPSTPPLTPIDPKTGLPTGKVTWQTLSTAQKFGAAAVGAAVATTIGWAWKRYVSGD